MKRTECSVQSKQLMRNEEEREELQRLLSAGVYRRRTQPCAEMPLTSVNV